MEALENLMSRRSPNKLAEPAPTKEALDKAMAAAVRAPDHGRLKPWRFLVIESEARAAFGDVMARCLMIESEARAAFGDVMARCLKRQQPDANEEMLKREREKAFRAPTIVVAVAKIQPQHPKIPDVEQLLAAGAATQNFWLALHAQGYGVYWKTGAPAYDAQVKRELGLADADQIVGFMYVGSIVAPAMDVKRPEAEGYVERWTQPAA
jgi:nitroreductase